MKTSYHFRVTLSIIIGIVLVGLAVLAWAQQTGKITIFGDTTNKIYNYSGGRLGGLVEPPMDDCLEVKQETMNGQLQSYVIMLKWGNWPSGHYCTDGNYTSKPILVGENATGFISFDRATPNNSSGDPTSPDPVADYPSNSGEWEFPGDTYINYQILDGVTNAVLAQTNNTRTRQGQDSLDLTGIHTTNGTIKVKITLYRGTNQILTPRTRGFVVNYQIGTPAPPPPPPPPPPPAGSCSLTASAANVTPGSPVTLTWTSSGYQSLAISKNITGSPDDLNLGASGTKVYNPTQSTLYMLLCWNTSPPGQQSSVIVEVGDTDTARIDTFTINEAASTTVAYGTPATLAWTASNIGGTDNSSSVFDLNCDGLGTELIYATETSSMPNGTRSKSFTENTTCTLKAWKYGNADATTTPPDDIKTITVTVTGSPPIDPNAPATPTGFSASANSDCTANLSWTASTSPLADGYRFQWSTQPKFPDVGIENVAYTDKNSGKITGLSVNTTYYVWIDAWINMPLVGASAGVYRSAPAGPVSFTTGTCSTPTPTPTPTSTATSTPTSTPTPTPTPTPTSATIPTTPDTQNPTAPGNLIGTPVGSDGVDLTWTASTDNVGVTGYDIYDGNNQLIGTTADNKISLKGLTCNSTYRYYIKAHDLAGNQSEKSNTVEIKTGACPTAGGGALAGLTKLVSTGSSLWLNILIAIALAAGIAYFLLRRKEV